MLCRRRSVLESRAAAEIADPSSFSRSRKHSSCWSNSRPPINGCCNSSVWMGKKRSPSCTTTCGRGWKDCDSGQTTCCRAQHGREHKQQHMQQRANLYRPLHLAEMKVFLSLKYPCRRWTSPSRSRPCTWRLSLTSREGSALLTQDFLVIARLVRHPRA